jgi:hypothetical protein
MGHVGRRTGWAPIEVATLMVGANGYVLGHSEVELRRLPAHARLIDP